ncbi:hypothetical protein [Shewanella sp. UCD-KL21]|uniref:hypothetical protein n=1 Tax=Shewanella sp. UCD-KL21 TaxID=1917164 RepID=UPI0009FAB437|nr:hypothetical protein [Shewanella sp. UCD-KL21]
MVTTKKRPTESNLALLREAQTQALTMPNTAMAVTIDIGDSKDIHPRNKQEVARRLWLAAQKPGYNNIISFSGPKLASVTMKNNSKIVVKFDTLDRLYIKGPLLLGFEIAGADKVYYQAEAHIVSLNQVLLSSINVPEPISICYAWANNSPANLFDSKDLPAIPFRYGEIARK